MKKIITSILLLTVLLTTSATSVSARVSVKGYMRKSGSYVAPHYRSNSNSYKYDNWSSRGNYNPYTGKKGYTNW